MDVSSRVAPLTDVTGLSIVTAKRRRTTSVHGQRDGRLSFGVPKYFQQLEIYYGAATSRQFSPWMPASLCGSANPLASRGGLCDVHSVTARVPSFAGWLNSRLLTPPSVKATPLTPINKLPNIQVHW